MESRYIENVTWMQCTMYKYNEVTCILHKLLNDPLPCTVIAMACSKGKFINFNMTRGDEDIELGGGPKICILQN